MSHHPRDMTHHNNARTRSDPRDDLEMILLKQRELPVPTKIIIRATNIMSILIMFLN